MAAKPTSVAAIIAKQTAAKNLENEQEDKKLSKKSVPEGHVWVRLRRAHYDANGTYHPIGAALLREGAIPSSAKRLTSKEAAQAEIEASDD